MRRFEPSKPLITIRTLSPEETEALHAQWARLAVGFPPVDVTLEGQWDPDWDDIRGGIDAEIARRLEQGLAVVDCEQADRLLNGDPSKPVPTGLIHADD